MLRGRTCVLRQKHREGQGSCCTRFSAFLDFHFVLCCISVALTLGTLHGPHPTYMTCIPNTPLTYSLQSDASSQCLQFLLASACGWDTSLSPTSSPRLWPLLSLRCKTRGSGCLKSLLHHYLILCNLIRFISINLTKELLYVGHLTRHLRFQDKPGYKKSRKARETQKSIIGISKRNTV